MRVESHRRALAKAITWRIVGLAITVTITWVVTGQASWAASVGALDTVIKLGSYYMHERAWNRSRFGRIDSRVA